LRRMMPSATLLINAVVATDEPPNFTTVPCISSSVGRALLPG